MRVEQSPNFLGRNLRKPLRAVGAVALVVGLSGCMTSNQEVVNNGSVKKVVGKHPDLSGFVADGDSTKCHNGGARPCAIAIRQEPSLDSPIMNVDPNATKVDWPLEPYNGQGGDLVMIECFKAGQEVTPFQGGGSSSSWYRVDVPVERITNPVFQSAVGEAKKRADVPASYMVVEGYASAEWFGQALPDPNVPMCDK